MDKIAVTVIGLGVLIGLTPFIIEEVYVEERTTTFPANVTVHQPESQTGNLPLGLNTASGLNFGRMPTDAEYVKSINISIPKKSLVTVSSTGNISKIMEFKRYHYFEGQKEIQLTLNASNSGYYAGNVSVKTSTPDNMVAERWIALRSGYLLPF